MNCRQLDRRNSAYKGDAVLRHRARNHERVVSVRVALLDLCVVSLTHRVHRTPRSRLRRLRGVCMLRMPGPLTITALADAVGRRVGNEDDHARGLAPPLELGQARGHAGRDSLWTVATARRWLSAQERRSLASSPVRPFRYFCTSAMSLVNGLNLYTYVLSCGLWSR